MRVSGGGDEETYVGLDGTPVALGNQLRMEEGGNETDRGGTVLEEITSVVEVDAGLRAHRVSTR